MNWEALGAIGELVGAFTVVVTLIYLSIQVRQNTSSLKANAYQGWMSANILINSSLASPGLSTMIAEGNINSKNLTKENFVAFGMIYISIMQMAQSIDYLYKTGSLEKELWETEMSRVAGMLSMPGVRQWWDAGGRTQLAPSFVKQIESMKPDIHFWNWDSEQGFYEGNAYVLKETSHDR